MQVEDVAGEADFNTLTRWLMINTKDKELTVLMAQLALACKATSRACAKAGIANLFGMAGEQNSTGDDQKKLDVLSNDFFVNALVKSGSCCVLVSEENEEPIIVPEEHAGRFCVAFDPLDGSSNIDCNVSTGTIFAVYERTSTGPIGEVGDILRTGNDIVAAGYCMYGAATELVMCFKQGKVERFALDPSLGEFIHTHADVQFPEGGGKKIYSCNEGNALNW
jgi:fructose-1,6-bisphosphatase I